MSSSIVKCVASADDFTLWAFPLTATWTEGRGLDNDNYSNTGYADAVSATKTQAWNDNDGQTGGNAFLGFDTGVYDSNSATQYFENGQEDLKLDVTDYFKAYLNYSSGTSIAGGGSADHGFLVRMSNAQSCKDATEAAAAGVNASVSGLSFWTKKFYARETNTRKAPYFQLELYKGKNQSTNRYKDYNIWLEKYWRDTVKLCHHTIKKNSLSLHQLRRFITFRHKF